MPSEKKKFIHVKTDLYRSDTDRELNSVYINWISLAPHFDK